MTLPPGAEGELLRAFPAGGIVQGDAILEGTVVSPAAAGWCRHSTLSLTAIHCHSLGIYRLILLSFSVKMTVSSVAIAAAGRVNSFSCPPMYISFVIHLFWYTVNHVYKTNAPVYMYTKTNESQISTPKQTCWHETD